MSIGYDKYFLNAFGAPRTRSNAVFAHISNLNFSTYVHLVNILTSTDFKLAELSCFVVLASDFASYPIPNTI